MVAALINQKDNMIEGIRYAAGSDRRFHDHADPDTKGGFWQHVTVWEGLH